MQASLQLITIMCRSVRADHRCHKVSSPVLRKAALHVSLASARVTKACGVVCADGTLCLPCADVTCGSAGSYAVLATRHVLLLCFLVPQLRRQHLCRAQLRASHFVIAQHKLVHQARCSTVLRRSQAVPTCLCAMVATLRRWSTSSKAARAFGRLAGARCFSSA